MECYLISAVLKRQVNTTRIIHSSYKNVNMSLTLAIDCEVENVAVSYSFIKDMSNLLLLFSDVALSENMPRQSAFTNFSVALVITHSSGVSGYQG